jgi:hypothetical protein
MWISATTPPYIFIMEYLVKHSDSFTLPCIDYNRYNHFYNYHNCGQYPSPCLIFKTRRFGDWILDTVLASETLLVLLLVSRGRDSSFYWANQSRFHLKMETQSSFQNYMLQIKDKTMDTAQNCDSYIVSSGGGGACILNMWVFKLDTGFTVHSPFTTFMLQFRKPDNLTAICEPIVWKMLEP